MSWLKDVILDISATVLIIAAVLINNGIVTGIVWGYTGLLLLVKVLVLVGDDFLNIVNKSKSEAPQWFTHLLYAINTGAFLYFEWWYAGACWLLIWISSYLAQRKLNKKATA